MLLALNGLFKPVRFLQGLKRCLQTYCSSTPRTGLRHPVRMCSSVQFTRNGESGMTDGKAFSSSTLGGDMPFWRVYTDLFPRGRVDFKDGVCQRQLSWMFCSEVMHQHAGCGACAHALSILTPIKSYMRRSKSHYLHVLGCGELRYESA